MKNSGNLIKIGSFLAAAILFLLSGGCATTSQLEELQMKADQALQEAQHATEMANNAETKCMNYKTDATEEYRAVGAAADRAERAAQRAENAAKSAKEYADDAKASADKVQEMYDRMTAK